MTIFVNGRFAFQPMSGVQRYAGEILRALDAIATEKEIVLLSPIGAPDAGLTRIEQRFVGRGIGHGWDQWAFARTARDEVALSLAMSGPLFHPCQLVVIHDAAVHRHPGHFSRRYAAGHRLLDRGLARRATIATVSEFSRAELAQVLGIPVGAIVVAPNGADHVRALPDPAFVAQLGLRPRRFFLMVGNLTANKNVAVALRAIDRLDHPDTMLVVVGAAHRGVFGAAELAAHPQLLLAGRLDDGAVAALMGAACALVFPSHYEGFGLPPLEAMALGCPVLASDCAAALEVCGGAAEHFAPDDDLQLAGLMRMALADSGAWREAQIAAGKVRAQHFRWEGSAQILLDACTTLRDRRVRAA